MHSENSNEHFSSDEYQDKRQALLQMVKFVDYVLNQEKQGAKPHNGKYVGSKNYK